MRLLCRQPQTQTPPDSTGHIVVVVGQPMLLAWPGWGQRAPAWPEISGWHMLYSDRVGDLAEYIKYLDREWSSDRLMDAIAAIYAEEPGRELPHYITDRVCCRIERWWLAMWYARLVRDTFNLDDEDWIAHCRATTQPDERHASLTAEERNQGARL